MDNITPEINCIPENKNVTYICGELWKREVLRETGIIEVLKVSTMILVT